MKRTLTHPQVHKTTARAAAGLSLGFITLLLAGVASADAPGGRTPPGGMVPNPGTQQQELANITLPAPYNTFEFVVTCAGCHSGANDLSTAHFGNWAGTAMASAIRDPIFRANQQIVNDTIKSLTGQDGGGNICIRCHSPNAWYSGRTDPTLGGKGDASNLEPSILLSTDGEGILCEFCHRSVGNVTMKRADLSPADPVWNMMAGLSDWPHAGTAFPAGPAAGNPYGDNTMQVADGLPYSGKYPGYIKEMHSDIPMTGTLYTGQTYAILPNGYPQSFVPVGQPATNPVGQRIYYAPDGTVPTHLEVPVGPPLDASGNPNYQAQSVSLEHPTNGATRDAQGEGHFVTSPEFCGTCHELTIPVLNHGMPEQRTYTEWKNSALGVDGAATYKRCQDCHMPTMKAEYSDNARVTLNPDPIFTGWFPYAKDRNPDGGVAFHKFDGSNADLPQMMSVLYPEVDLEVVGAPTGADNRLFGGMLSGRETMWERSLRNNQVSMSTEALAVQIVSGPTYNAALSKWEVQVKVTNNTGHRLPTGYPDGRRIILSLTVKNAAGATVYQSGFYDEASASLYTDAAKTGFKRALTPVIDSSANAVMVYEKVTGTCVGSPTPTSCSPSVSLLNNVILFNNAIPPAGYNYALAGPAGAKFIVYNPANFVPQEDANRYGAGSTKNNYDVVTYRFAAPANAQLKARAEVRWQTHTRDFMEHLKNSNVNTYRPLGPPNPLDPNYPLTPNYLSDQIPNFGQMTDLAGAPLRDNWGGIAYAAWLLTGKGSPHLVAAADTSVATPPAAPALVVVYNPWDAAASTPVRVPFTQIISWTAAARAESYIVWVRYGLDTSPTDAGLTASWDRLAQVRVPTTILTNTGLTVGKTYQYRVQAVNAAGASPYSAAVLHTTGVGLPDMPPTNLNVIGSTDTTISMAWIDESTNEDFFRVERQDVPMVGNYYWVADVPSPHPAGFGGVSWTDSGLQPGRTFNYRVSACNVNGCTTPTPPATGSTGGAPAAPAALTAVAANGRLVNLAWTAGGGAAVGFRVERSAVGPTGPWTDAAFAINDPAATTLADNTVTPNRTYWYRVIAYNFVGDSPASNIAQVTTPSEPPRAPTTLVLVSTQTAPLRVNLRWTDNAAAPEELRFELQRVVGSGAVDWAAATTINVPARGGTGTVNYTDSSGLLADTTYSYRARACNAGGCSAYTNIVVAVTPGTEVPQAPAQLRASKIEKLYIILAWMDNATNETRYEVHRSTNGTTFTQVATLGINATSFQNNSLTANTTYWYRVRACNAVGCSAFSETISAKTKA